MGSLWALFFRHRVVGAEQASLLLLVVLRQVRPSNPKHLRDPKAQFEEGASYKLMT